MDLHRGRPWRTRTAHAAVVSALVLGVGDTFRRREAVAVVEEDRRDEPAGDRLILFFHPEVPEATLVVVR